MRDGRRFATGKFPSDPDHRTRIVRRQAGRYQAADRAGEHHNVRRARSPHVELHVDAEPFGELRPYQLGDRLDASQRARVEIPSPRPPTWSSAPAPARASR